MTAVLAVAALIGVGVCGLGWWRASGRVAALSGRVARLEREVHDDVVPTLDLTRRESEEAYVAARMAKHAVGIEDPPPRLAGEAVTGPVVRAVAFGAGARRAFARLAADVTPMARTRRNTLRIVSAATRTGRGDAKAATTKQSDKRKRKAG
ncbi:MAG: hypothetical protein WDA60_00070 [Acidimicrobiia bacterium]